MNPRSLRFQLLSRFAGLLLLAMLGFGACTYFSVERYVSGVLSKTLNRRAQSIVDMLLSGTGAGAATDEPYLARQIETRYAPELNDRFLRITRAGGATIYRSGDPHDHSFSAAQVPPLEGKISAPRTRLERTADGVQLLIAAVPYGNYIVESGSSLAESRRVLDGLLCTLAAGLFILLGLTMLGGWFLIRRALAPVQDMMRAAQDITLSHLSRRLPVADTGDEIASLSVALNQMIVRLDESFQHTSRFTSDASHELRTPLTIMRGELEALLSRADLDADLRDMLASLLEEVERLVRIVERLFALARLDTGEARGERVRFDLANLAETTAEQMCLLAEEKEIALECRTKDRVEVEGDRARIKQIVVNLLDNAIKYTPRQGRVTLSVRAQNGSAILEVADTGPGIPPVALPHVFERFYRADEVHSRDVDGSGLGLSIVHSICAAHGGTVALENLMPQGCRATVRLPAANS